MQMQAKKIIIGRDSMFSHDIDLWAGDGHTIFDVSTGKNINSASEKQPSHRNAIKLESMYGLERVHLLCTERILEMEAL